MRPYLKIFIADIYKLRLSRVHVLATLLKLTPHQRMSLGLVDDCSAKIQTVFFVECQAKVGDLIEILGEVQIEEGFEKFIKIKVQQFRVQKNVDMWALFRMQTMSVRAREIQEQGTAKDEVEVIFGSDVSQNRGVKGVIFRVCLRIVQSHGPDRQVQISLPLIKHNMIVQTFLKQTNSSWEKERPNFQKCLQNYVELGILQKPVFKGKDFFWKILWKFQLLDLSDRLIRVIYNAEDGIKVNDISQIINKQLLGLQRKDWIVDFKGVMQVLQKLKNLNRIYRVDRRIMAVKY